MRTVQKTGRSTSPVVYNVETTQCQMEWPNVSTDILSLCKLSLRVSSTNVETSYVFLSFFVFNFPTFKCQPQVF